ncbi:GNAT family N-acetyltransferase [Cellulomonas sp. PhB143]|uniref:GNAT family N-acetyltransferase n=1 Tax=Cellulomonas sp. PhB143 TaxID=2485186 RepID=UPI000F491F33|nr:GNAT family N-acetyltransferase [Cellulomonas sp. PhB143]ROS74562.1 FR47-like protein [Cellulomonas sp. PhB143]
MRVEGARRDVRATWSSPGACLLLAAAVEPSRPGGAAPGWPTPGGRSGPDRLALWALGEPEAAAELILAVARAGGLPGPDDAAQVVGGCVPRGTATLDVLEPTRAGAPPLPEILGRPATSAWDWWSTTTPPAWAGAAGGPAARELSGDADRAAVLGALAAGNPGAELDPTDLATRWWGVRSAATGELLSVAGASVHPAGWEIGGVATVPHARGAGLGSAVVAGAAAVALAHAPYATLGMYADNDAARAVYARLGFVVGQEFAGWRVRVSGAGRPGPSGGAPGRAPTTPSAPAP